MFKITDGKGFQVTFENGITVSVQFGYGNYCENYDKPIFEKAAISPTGHFLHQGQVESKNAELAIIGPGKMWRLKEFDTEQDDDVAGHVDAAYVLKALIWASEQK